MSDNFTREFVAGELEYLERMETKAKEQSSLAAPSGSDSRPARQLRVIETLIVGSKAAHEAGDTQLHREYCIAIAELLILWEKSPNDRAKQPPQQRQK